MCLRVHIYAARRFLVDQNQCFITYRIPSHSHNTFTSDGGVGGDGGVMTIRCVVSLRCILEDNFCNFCSPRVTTGDALHRFQG